MLSDSLKTPNHYLNVNELIVLRITDDILSEKCPQNIPPTSILIQKNILLFIRPDYNFQYPQISISQKKYFVIKQKIFSLGILRRLSLFPWKRYFSFTQLSALLVHVRSTKILRVICFLSNIFRDKLRRMQHEIISLFYFLLCYF